MNPYDYLEDVPLKTRLAAMFVHAVLSNDLDKLRLERDDVSRLAVAQAESLLKTLKESDGHKSD